MMITGPEAAIYESVAWILNDLMTDIKELDEIGQSGSAKGYAYLARDLFDALPNQPDDRDYAEKGREEVRKLLKSGVLPADIAQQLQHPNQTPNPGRSDQK